MQRDNNKIVRAFDVTVQASILLCSLITGYLIGFGLIIGGTWQLFSYWLIRNANGGNQTEERQIYWVCTKVVLGILTIGMLMVWLADETRLSILGMLSFMALIVAFIGGVLLYITYMCICLKELLCKK